MEEKLQTADKHPSMVKKWFLYIMIGGLIVTALISIVAIVIGEWNNLITKAILLTVSSWIHTLIALAIASADFTSSGKKSYYNIFVFAFFGAVIASFITTVLNIFDIIPVEYSVGITAGLYFWYAGVLAASLVAAAMLTSAAKKDKATALATRTGVGALALFMLLFFFPIFHRLIDIPDVYYRILLALSVVFSTTIIIAVILGHLYTTKHPKIAKDATYTAPTETTQAASGTAEPHKGLPTWVIILIVVASLFWGLPLLGGFLGFFIRLLY
jgi:hypothetical protein